MSFQAVVFDCDGTLSAVEGIDSLACWNGVFHTVHQLTQDAMTHTGLNPIVYRKRLELVRPTWPQMASLAHQYGYQRVPDSAEVIRCLHALHKDVYIVSAGIQQAVCGFAQSLCIPPERVYAVDVQWHQNCYVDFDHASPLVRPYGKRTVLHDVHASYDRMVLIGDGMNDLEAATAVERFIGYGGVYTRPEIAKGSFFYITCASMSAILPLILDPEEIAYLSPCDLALYRKGRRLLNISTQETHTSCNRSKPIF